MKNKSRFINFRPVLLTALALLIGVGGGYVTYIYSKLTAIIYVSAFFVATIIMFILLIIKKADRRYIIIIPILILFAIFGGINTYKTIKNYEYADITEQAYLVEGKITDATYFEGSTELTVSNLTFRADNDFTSDYKLLLTVTEESDYGIGDYILVSCTLSNGSVYFDETVNLYAIKDGIKYYATVLSDDSILLKYTDKTVFERLRLFIENSLSEGLSDNVYGVAKAMLLGNTDSISDDLLASFRYAGVAHIFAVSGLHIGFLSGVLLFIFNKLKLKKAISSPIIIAVLFLYSGICGFTVSSLRAAIMFGMMTLSGIFNSRYDGITSISFGAIIVLSIFPLEMFSAGFLLSFTVTLFIIILTRPITNFLNRLFCKIRRKSYPVQYLSKQNKLSSAMAVAISSFIASVPLSLAFFEYISPISIIVNILFIPIASIIFTYLLSACIIGGLFSISFYTLYPAKLVIQIINGLFWTLDAYRFALFTESLKWFSIAYYLSFLVMAGLFNFNKRLTKIITVSLLCISFGGYGVLGVMSRNGVEIYSVSDGYTCASLFVESDSAVMVINGDDNSSYYSEIERVLTKSDVNNLDALIIADENSNIISVLMAITNCVTVQKVYYYGDFVAEYYNSVPLYNIGAERVEFSNRLSGKYLPSGYGFELTFNNRSFATYSYLPDNDVRYFITDTDYDYIISASFVKELSEAYDKPVLAYREVDNAQNAQTKGIVLRRFYY